MAQTSQNFSVIQDEGLSRIPLEKDGIGVCKRCAYIDFTRHFYPKQKEFCSKSCSQSFHIRSLKNRQLHEYKFASSTDHFIGMIPMEPLPQVESAWPVLLEDLMPTHTPKMTLNIANSYEWKDELFGCDFLAAPVRLFRHAPLHDMFDNTFEGMKVEVKNTDCALTDKISDFFWVATVVKVKGYMGQLRYEGFGSDDTKDFWVNLCCSEVHPVGWCATRGKPLIPPKSIEDKYSDWKKFLVKQLTGARTLPSNFYTKFREASESRLSINNLVEVVDKNRISQVKLATITEIVGKRLHIKYYNSPLEDNGFWCHEDSPLIHPVGWAFNVGHTLDAPANYCERIAAGVVYNVDSTPDMFSPPPFSHLKCPSFIEGMKLEAVDPLNLSSVCAATVMKVLNNGYMMIRIDVYPVDVSGADWFCYHQRSPCIFPVGFCEANNVQLIPPAGYTKDNFSWATYLMQTHAVPAGPEMFPPRSSVEHGFVSGMRLECADLMDPRLVCVATVARVVGNMLKVHFDGWGSEYDQWLWGGSTDMYPVGWCRAVGHRLEGPLQPAPPPPRRPARTTRQRRRKAKPVTQSPSTGEKGKQNQVTTEISMASNEDSQTSHTTEPEQLGKTFESPSQNVSLNFESEFQEHVMKMEAIEREAMGGFEQEAPHEYEQAAPEEFEQAGPEEFEQAAAEEFEPEAPEEVEQYDSQEIEQGVLEEIEQGVPEEIEQGLPEGIEQAVPEGFEQGVPEGIEQGVPEGIELEAPEASEKEVEDKEMEDLDQMIQEEEPPVEDEEEMDEDMDQEKVIPCLLDKSPTSAEIFKLVDPDSWTTADVSKFLTVNDCQTYCVNFSHIDGPAMMKLSKDEIITLLELKVGPSVKISDLINKLKCKIRPRHMLNSFKK